jgi:hypothetical protein
LIFGFILALILECGGIYLMAQGQSAAGLVVIFVPFIGLVEIFIRVKKERESERKRTSKNISEKNSF